jgi:hypothetical protein
MICGIDPSLSGTACCIGQTLRRFSTEGSLSVAERQPSLIVIEGYAFGSLTAGHHDVVEYGGILRRALVHACGSARFIEVTPTALKAFGCGKGNAKKAYLADAIAERYQLRFSSNDELDAWVLWRIGECLAGRSTPRPGHELAAIERMKAPRTPKPRKPSRRGRKTSDQGRLF